MAYFGILARVHTQQVSEESYSEPEFVPRFSLAKLKLEPGYKSGLTQFARLARTAVS